MFSCLKKNIDRGLHSGKIFTVCNQFLWAKILVTFRRGNVVSTLYPCMFSCAKSQIFFCFEKEKSALNRKKNVYALKGFVYNLKAIFPGIGKESAYTHYSLAATKLFFSSLTQRCLIVIHLCAAILWIVVNVLVFCASLCSVYWREQFGAGLEELVCVVDFLYMFLISMFYSFVFHIINHILAASSFCLCTSGWFFFFFFSGWTVRESSLAFTSLNSTSHFYFEPVGWDFTLSVWMRARTVLNPEMSFTEQ